MDTNEAPQNPPAVSGELPGVVLQLLRDLTDSDSCIFDHHGGCQAHGFLDLGPGEECPNALGRRILTERGRAV